MIARDARRIYESGLSKVMNAIGLSEPGAGRCTPWGGRGGSSGAPVHQRPI